VARIHGDLDFRIRTLAEWVVEAERLVVFTGAGISTESGLPDFRERGWNMSTPCCILDLRCRLLDTALIRKHL